MTSLAQRFAEWAIHYQPMDDDLELANRSLLDTVAVALAAQGDPLARITAELPPASRWSALGHVLDYDDLHVESTTHISVVCVPATLTVNGDARAYLAGAGTMARLGKALGWQHYARGWHATCTAGAPAAAVAAAVAMELDREQITNAIALAIPASGGNQRAFGTHAKALQVGFATEAGVRAAQLAANGATADPFIVEQWLELIGASPSAVSFDGPAVPGGLAVKLFPCCYALQRPICVAQLLGTAGVEASEVVGITVEALEGTVRPLLHHQPVTGLQAKFSLEYAIAAALLDGDPGFESFSDEAVNRDRAQRLLRQVQPRLAPGGDDLLAGELVLSATTRSGAVVTRALRLPPGAPARPPSDQEMAAKLARCGAEVPALLQDVDWSAAVELLNNQLAIAAQ